MRTTGLTDFGDAAFRAALGRLVDALEGEADLTLLGRVIARTDLVRFLENRLRMVDTIHRHPEITAAPIERPLFIVGLPRTGTSILHELLAQDPANRVPMTWEVMHPWPPPERATYTTDPRIAQVDRHFAGVDRLIPGFKAMHPMGATLPQECVALTAHDFASMVFHPTYRVPSYQAWLDAADLRGVYASHRRQLQYLQWRCPGERWVLKSPGHLWALDALLAVYPDARIVQTHRDPLKVVASLANLVALLRTMASDRVDRHEIGTDWTRLLAAGLERSMAVRARRPEGDPQVFDMHFAELLRDEIGMVRRIYAHFGLDLSADAEARMRRFLAANPRDRHGVHRYTLAAAGLNARRERLRFAAYQARFGIASEPVE
jgi:Sulfotransferase family